MKIQISRYSIVNISRRETLKFQGHHVVYVYKRGFYGYALIDGGLSPLLGLKLGTTNIYKLVVWLVVGALRHRNISGRGFISIQQH